MKKLTIGLLLIALSLDVFASIESEVEAERFQREGDVLIDTFSGLSWQDNRTIKNFKGNWQSAKTNCKHLSLNGKNNWRLPTITELKYAYKIKNKFKNIASDVYWSSSNREDRISGAWNVHFGWNGEDVNANKVNVFHALCNKTLEGIKKFDNFNILKNKIDSTRKSKINDYKINASKNYKVVKQQNNISGHEWFINKYPSASQTKEAIKNIHKLAYKKAKEINTISSYNTFIISYPYAKQIKDAIEKSSVLETKKYENIKKDDERKARLLAVKIKKLTIQAKKSSNDIGYQIVINRMSNLLTTKYEETDASLRHYESKEFTDFASKFESTMNDIKNVLNKINNNTQDLGKYAKQMIEVAKDGFASANVDRDMSSYKLEQHEKWEKFMHFRDKGYN
jgi:hypothetical protein